MAALAEAGAEPRSLLVTFGADGASLGRRDGARPTRCAADEVADTTGAGDAFCGALAASLAGGADREAALEVALAAGAAAVRQGRPARPPALTRGTDPRHNFPARCGNLQVRATTVPVRT